NADLLGLAFVAGSSTQRLGPDTRDILDYHRMSAEVSSLKTRLAALNVSMPAYYAHSIPPDARKLFELAKLLGVEVIIGSAQPGMLPAIEQLADEFAINVALPSGASLKETMGLLAKRGKRIGISADISEWRQQGIKPLAGLSVASDRLMVVSLAGNDEDAA